MKYKTKRNIFIIILIIIVGLYYDELEGLLDVSYANVENSNENYTVINDNNPDFFDNYSLDSFESYSDLDSLGRAGVAMANLGIDLMPTKEREYIGMIKPSGWQIAKYDFIDGKYLYNRCHLIGYQLTGQNANPKNLITCTRQMNAETMTIFENKVASYIRKTKNHVLYRVTPVFDGNNLLATGVQMEAKSLEDDGKGIKFNVFVYNIQDNIIINYLDGSNHLKSEN